MTARGTVPDAKIGRGQDACLEGGGGDLGYRRMMEMLTGGGAGALPRRTHEGPAAAARGRRPLVWALAACLALAIGAALAIGGLGFAGSAPVTAGAGARAAKLDLGAREAFSALIGARQAAYRAGAVAGGFEAANPAQGLGERFGRSGVEISTGALRVGLGLRSVAFGRVSEQLADPLPSARGNSVRYARSGLSEWYRNGPVGLEQGFTIAAAPAGEGSQPLTLTLAATGNGRAKLAATPTSVTWSGPEGSSLRYGELSATDARGRSLPTRIGLERGALTLRVDTSGARYPIRIDPLMQQAKLLSGAKAGIDRFGRSVALSADGNTALIGEPRASNEVGAAWVFARTGATWALEAKLEGQGHAGGVFGRSVALSAAGDVALVGEPGREGSTGGAWAFVRGDSGWERVQLLEGVGESPRGEFGARVALSGDGKTALVSAILDRGRAGSVWAFTSSEGKWAEQAELQGGGEEGAGQFGRGLALSGDGDIAVIGAPINQGRIGAAWVFARSGPTWSAQAELQGREESGKGHFGGSVALSPGGGTALVGGSEDGEGVGAAWVFADNEGVWTQQGPKLVADDEVGAGAFGASVALADEGTEALIGGLTDDGGIGAAWLFAQAGSSWTQDGPKLLAEEEDGPGRFGASVAFSADGGSAVIGGFEDDESLGAAWAFGTTTPAVSEVAPKEGPEGGGTLVTITGTGFADSSTVAFGTNAAMSVQFVSSTEIKARAPAGSGTVDVIVTTAGESSPAGTADRFTYLEPEPTKTITGTTTNTNTNTSTGSAGGSTLSFTTTQVPAPVLGVGGNIAPVSGQVFVQLPGSAGFVSLTTLRDVPFGTVVDARHGHVVVITATPGGGTQKGEFFDGEFILSQGADGRVVATLTGGSFGVCPTSRERSRFARASSRHTSAKHVVRKLWANAHGKFSTKGHYAAGAVLGTEWLTEDFCDGTLIRVTRDKVRVTNLVTHHSVVVHVHHSYFAKAP